MNKIIFCVVFLLCNVILVHSNGSKNQHRSVLRTVFSWNQLSYDFDGDLYLKSTDTEHSQNGIHFEQDVEESEKFFVQYNNVPIGLEVYGDTVFVTVPRRKFGIPSTLNYISTSSSSSPHLKPYPAVGNRDLVSVYRPRVDQCGRLWAVDTGLLEVPGARKQIQPPAIIVYDLETNEQILRYELKASDLVNERTSGGLTSITVDVDPKACADAFAYINDLATEGLIVFSMRERDSWRINHQSFVHDESAMNFTVAGHTINWKDGLFSVALSDPDAEGHRTAYYHPLVSTQEFAVRTDVLKCKGAAFAQSTLLGSRGPLTQSGSHDYHSKTRTLLFANVAQDAILCWNVKTKMAPENVAIALQDHEKLVYISDLKVVGDHVWVLVNQIPRFVYSSLNTSETNYYVHKAKVRDLIRGTVCDPHQSKKGH